MSNKSSNNEFNFQTFIDGTGESVNVLTEGLGLGRVINTNKNSPEKLKKSLEKF